MPQEDELPNSPPPLVRQNAMVPFGATISEEEPSSDEEDEDPVAFIIILAIIAAIQLKHSTPKPVMRPRSQLFGRR